MKSMTAPAVAALLAFAVSTIATAHPLPRSAAPAPNAVLASSPAEIRIGFSEPLVGAFSGLSVADQAGRPAAVGPSRVAADDPKALVAAVRTPLGPGAYTVSWHAVAADTHHVQGHYSFQVKP